MVTKVASITKTLLNAKTEAEIATVRVELSGAVIDLQSKVAEMQTRYSQALEENESLKSELSRQKNWKEEAARYSLADMGGGIFAYRINEADRAGEPHHWLCAACYAENKKSILIKTSYGSDKYRCHNSVNHAIDLNEYA